MENQIIIEKLNRLEKLIIDSTKVILNVEDLVNYTGYKQSYIYKLVHKNILPYTKPNGSKIFFIKSEIDSWLRQNKSKSISQIQEEAHNYINNSRKK